MAHNKVKIGNTTIMDITDASLDLASDEIASGKSGYDGNGDKISGSLQNVSGGSYVMDDTLSVVPLQGPIYIPSSGSFSVSTLSTNHTAENIKKDVQLLGVTGTYDPLANVEYCVSGSLVEKSVVEYHLPSSVTSIGSSAFSGCSSLTTINTSSVTSIGSSAFNGCSSLTTINTSSVTSIGSSAFNGCSSLTTIDISNITSIGAYAFYNCSSLNSIVGTNVTTVGSNAFQICTGLTSANFPSLTYLQESTFQNCSNLQSLNVSNASAIYGSALYGCSALTNLQVKNGVMYATHYTLSTKAATIGSKTYIVKGNNSVGIYDAAAPTTVLGTISSSTTTYTDSDTGATFTWTSAGIFTITW